MGGLSIWHWLIVLVVVVLIFGTKKLRNIGQDLGGAVKGFKEGMKTETDGTTGAAAADADAGAADPGEDHRRRGQEGNDAVVVTNHRGASAARDGPRLLRPSRKYIGACLT